MRITRGNPLLNTNPTYSQTVYFSKDEHEHLLKLSKLHDCIATKGSRKGKNSIYVLMKKIAKGELEVNEKA